MKKNNNSILIFVLSSKVHFYFIFINLIIRYTMIGNYLLYRW